MARFHRRAATAAEVDAALAEDPGDELATFVVAGLDGHAVGCAGLRVLAPSMVEVKRMYVAPAARGHGVGRLLLAAVERAGRESGATAIRLDTRHDLIEARRLYTSSGYREIARYNDSPYADHWFEKRVTGPPAREPTVP